MLTKYLNAPEDEFPIRCETLYGALITSPGWAQERLNSFYHKNQYDVAHILQYYVSDVEFQLVYQDAPTDGSGIITRLGLITWFVEYGKKNGPKLRERVLAGDEEARDQLRDLLIQYPLLPKDLGLSVKEAGKLVDRESLTPTQR